MVEETRIRAGVGPYLGEHNLDDLGRMMFALLSEVWIMRDRMAVMERMLEQRGAWEAGAIDEFVPPPDFALQLEALRDRIAASVIGAPIAPHDRTVDAILTRAGLSRPPEAAATA